MSRKKIKAKTQLERLGFNDEDILKPDHDKIMFWLDENVEAIFAEEIIKTIKKSFLISSIERFKYEYDKYHDENISETEKKEIIKKLKEINNYSHYYSKNKEWELAITNNYGFKDTIVGFADFFFSFKPYRIEIVFPEEKEASSNTDNTSIIDLLKAENNKKNIINEIQQSKFIIEKSDINIFGDTEFLKGFFFEVKTEIKSLGELIRQINTYRSYTNVPFYVVSPDDRYEDKLKDQGIGFIKYTGQKIEWAY